MIKQLPSLHDGHLADARLRELGLSAEILLQAIEAAEMERRGCSSLEPSNAPGFRAWATGFRVLAENLVPEGWIKTETRGLPRLVNPDSGVAVALVHGDEGTGLINADPKSKRPRGIESIFLVRSNERQLSLFPGMAPILPPEQEQITWWLLIYTNGESVVRAELSLPVGLGDDSRLSVWKERVILEVKELEGIAVPLAADEDLPVAEVEVRRKRS